MWRDQTRACSFGEDAVAYDRARPAYPEALVDDLMAPGPRRVLDVGCGTGKAGRMFAARGCDVLGVEPDERMAAVARTHGLAVETVSIERWDSAGRTFDLVVSGQAWHWIDPQRALPRVVAALAARGRIAVFWNHSSHRSLPDAERSRLLGAVGRLIDDLGGALEVRYTTRCITAQRRNGPASIGGTWSQ